MQTTLDLLNKAEKHLGPISYRQLSTSLGHSPTALNNARHRGSLSPLLAGQLAQLTGENVAEWVALAAMEATPKSRVTEALKRAITAGHKV
jgi:hypothetical protein